jgi:tetratricopeptide (TPR) repeat protein
VARRFYFLYALFGGLLLALTLSGAPVSVAALLREARKLIDQNNLDGALRLLDQGKTADPQDSEVLYLRGYVLYRQRKLDSAKQDLNSVMQLTPPALQSRYLLGRIAQLEAHPQEAIRLLEPCALADPPVSDAAAQLSKLYWDTGQIAQAQTWTQKAVTQMPWDGSLHYRLGRIYQQNKQNELAKQEFAESMQRKTADSESVAKLMECSRALASRDAETALRIRGEFLNHPNLDPDLLVALGTTFAEAGAPAQAVELYQTAAQRDPQFFQAQFNFGLAELNLGQPANAISPLQASLHLWPQSKEANAALGLAYVMQGKFTDSVLPLEAARSADPADTRTTGLLSLAYYRTGAAAKAVPLLRETIQSAGEDPKFYFLLIECLNATEQQAEALTVADQALTKFPTLARAWMGKAQQLARLGKYHEAGPLFAKAAELAPNQPEPLLGLGEAEQKDGNYEAALQHYQQAMSQNGGPTAVLGAARSLVFLRRLPEARTMLEQSLHNFEENSQLHYELSRVYARLGEKELAAEQTKITQRLKTQTASAPQ